ncbi:type II toxin-antitoxin system RelE/ParE family toxin [Lactiplantibacillus songbeiensis]|uniref:Type II toxin-antitoxin system YoeB family toxin n=1 Tax=Lactiplantibacillus songbeiensis TaxID=2559920 RepID=A0ABW4C356_9LACO|nr:type II toxin-antitoxin system YoeB family toxin [Lactiplantibacillus songbeiensis]
MIFESLDEIEKLPVKYQVIPYKKVVTKDLPKLDRLNLRSDFDEIVEILKRKPQAHLRHNEKLSGYTSQGQRSMRINQKHRVVFSIGKTEVFIWSAWGHYTKR